MKCIPKHTDYNCIQWKGNNLEEIRNFCKENTLTLNYQDNKLIFHNKYDPNYNQIIKLGDYIIKKNNLYFDILSEEDFKIMYEIISN